MSGLVSIIGAGPGDSELITKKGIKRLKRADIVFHDKLSPNELIEDYCQPSADIKDVGKRKGKVGPDQSEINQMLVESARTNDFIVRLKGGDPFLFGRGGEETEHLADNDIDFEIIPGVSSVTAVPASAGIPLTHRNHSSSVGIITGHFNKNTDDEHDWKTLARMESLVIMMGVTRASSIATKLMEAGKSPSTPAAIIGWGATPRQKSHISDLSNLKNNFDKAKDFLPGLIIIGSVVNCRTQLKWYENRPLFGKKIVVTRPEKQSDRLTENLREAGARVVSCPTIEISRRDEGIEELQNVLPDFDNYDWVVFTSRNAIKYFFGVLRESRFDLRILGNTNFACVGPGTSKRLKQEGINSDLIPKKHQGEGLGEALCHELDNPSKILLPRSANARKTLVEQLEADNHSIEEILLYESTLPRDRAKQKLREILSESTADMITFTSSSTVENLFESLNEKLVRSGLENMERAAIGPITAETLESYGSSATLLPDESNLQSFINAIKTFYIQNPSGERNENLS